MRLVNLAALCLLATACATEQPIVTDSPQPQAAASVQPAGFDPAAHLWLEEVEGEEALGWVRAQNARTLASLEGDARYPAFFAAALEIATSKTRIPYGSVRNGFVYNFWQDDVHVRGLWRRTTLDGYGRDVIPWETILDIDALAKTEGANWVYKGVDCLPPDNTMCLVSLSDGGKDAVVRREFDVSTRSFVSGGFSLPEAKSDVAWVDKDTLLVATDWGEANAGSLTESGYPFIVKRLKRGQPLSAAEEVFRGTREDVAASPMVLSDETGRRWFGAVRAPTFFTSIYVVFGPEGRALTVPVPAKSSLTGLHGGLLLVRLDEDWTPAGQGAFRSGDLVGFNWEDFLASGQLPQVELVFRPGARQAIQDVGIARGALLLNLSDNVATRVTRLARSAQGWTASDIALPDKGSASLLFTDEEESAVFLGFEGFLDPDTLYQYDAATQDLKQLKSLPAWFDAARYAVTQNEAVSKDGTRVPYFMVHRKDMALDGSNPTLMYGYGGFQVSYPPFYSGATGKLWLEQGGVYVLANIRGGGEFGPGWHQAGLKTKRQVIYDDFIAVAEDLIARKVTSPKKLGAMGGSNGGLLMGVMFIQRPDLFNAIVCQVPLLDMLRYHLLLAGASWIDEYGDPDVAEERAWLETLSPYHNVKPGVAYPEIYFETSTKDDRVHPGHARKMAKRLEELGLPFYYYENIDGGHSAAANQREAARRAALEFTYLARKLIDGT
jgi:prolyl oligopeptidase